MGQYYRAVITGDDGKIIKSLSSYAYGNGAKLIEHAHIGNSFVNAVLNTIAEMPGSEARLTWAGDYADKVGSENLYEMSQKDGSEESFASTEPLNVRFILNTDTKEYIDLWRYSEGEIHPLPVLCADGNGRGGGDYSGLFMDRVGSWKGCRIKLIEGFMLEMIPEGYREWNESPVGFIDGWSVREEIVRCSRIAAAALEQGISIPDIDTVELKSIAKIVNG